MNAETENVLSPRAVTATWDASKPEFRRVRRKLSLGFRHSYVLRFCTGFCIVVAASAIVWPFLPRRYEATATIILRPADAETSSESTQFMRQPLDESAIQSEIDRIASPALVSAVITQHQLAADPEFNGGVISWLKQRLFGQSSASEIDLRQRVLKRLTVSRERRSYTVKFGFRSSDRFKAAAMAETLFKAYLADQLERKRELIANLAGRLSERTDRLLAKWVSSQQAVTDFLVQSGLIDKGADISFERQLATLSSEAGLAQSRAMDAQARADALSELQKAGKLDAAPEVLASTFVQKLKEKMSGAKSTVSPVGMPQTAFDAEMTAELNRILQGVKTEARTSAQQVILLEREIKKIREEMTQRQLSKRRLAVLRQEAAADRRDLDHALTSVRAQIGRANAVRPDVEIIANPEVPVRPVFPNPLLALLGTLMAGCLAGTAMIWRPIAGWGRRVLEI